jgi:effector-binding domain-containing protein
VEQPQIEQRDRQPYVAIPATVKMQDLAAAIDVGYRDLFAWLAAHSLPPAGPPFIRYLTVNMDAELTLELAVPVDGSAPADGPVRPGVLPAGDYVTLLHVGPYDGLVQANAALQQWASERDVRWAMDGETWLGRIERYLTDPSQEPDPSKFQTELAYLTATDPPQKS